MSISICSSGLFFCASFIISVPVTKSPNKRRYPIKTRGMTSINCVKEGKPIENGEVSL